MQIRQKTKIALESRDIQLIEALRDEVARTFLVDPNL
jgi:hypothetical protein